ncbi:hypothetical protein TTHERM_00899540 (macronuclear) [Tetrahymena thermophila SB210]|uniref:Uncharacterized protein n=1 Tax=Tetrahymena thermophila (strain SB210) TaxID=312017 RepID=Q23YA9_TETTS|nr:hypothetical protein TTHERM_00899540 [Tetrahymena thermophila SB210]EAS01555.1 hypothetical protein TTHERM_00899540 [Tetrahymena thermophila SB210]|eukprot:XP_001021800.1 hypothetical protein TTHERM_00899540 [Tetrahymena thermophila SB210]
MSQAPTYPSCLINWPFLENIIQYLFTRQVKKLFTTIFVKGSQNKTYKLDNQWRIVKISNKIEIAANIIMLNYTSVKQEYLSLKFFEEIIAVIEQARNSNAKTKYSLKRVFVFSSTVLPINYQTPVREFTIGAFLDQYSLKSLKVQKV